MGNLLTSRNYYTEDPAVVSPINPSSTTALVKLQQFALSKQTEDKFGEVLLTFHGVMMEKVTLIKVTHLFSVCMKTIKFKSISIELVVVTMKYSTHGVVYLI